MTTVKDEDIFEEFIEEWATLKNLSKASIYKYRLVMKTFLVQLRHQQATLASIDRPQALKLIKWLQSSSWSEETRESYWDRFTRIYKWAYKRYGPWNQGAYELLVDRDEKYRYSIDENKVKRKGILTPEEVLALVYAELLKSFQYFVLIFRNYFSQYDFRSF